MSHQQCKKSIQKEKRELKKRKRLGHLKKEKIRLFENLGAWSPSCNGQHADACWVMACSHKTQSFMKNRGQQTCLDKALTFMAYGTLFTVSYFFLEILRIPDNGRSRNLETFYSFFPRNSQGYHHWIVKSMAKIFKKFSKVIFPPSW